ncbi:MAG: prohibitin family protein [Candidatus Babeliales bacterium]
MFKNMLPVFVIVMLAILMIAPLSFYIVNPGYTALHLRLGEVIKVQKQTGAYLKIPVIDQIAYIDNRILKSEEETTALTKDLQHVSIGIAINYTIEDAFKLYESVGTHFEEIIIDPLSQECIKAVVAKFTAEDLIQYRHTAKDMVFNDLRDRLALMHIKLIDFNFVHSDFSRDFMHAVEEKQIAEQSAKTAKNLTEKVKEEMIQAKSKADAEAYGLKVKKESVTQELIALKKAEALIRAIEKWDGHLPRVAGGNTPFLSMNDIG